MRVNTNASLFAGLIIALVAAAPSGEARAQSFEDGAKQLCDSYFTSTWQPSSGTNWVYGDTEVADVIVSRHGSNLTEADRLNGVEWSGIIQYRGKAIREGGAAWRNYDDPVFHCFLQFINGEWHGNATDVRYGKVVQF